MNSGFDSSSVIDFFIDEANEYIQGLTNGFLAVGDNPGDKALIHELFRLAHTLKGSSAMMGFNIISRVAHKMEDLLGKARSGNLILDQNHVDILFEALDVIRDKLEEIRSGGETEVDVDDLLSALEAACEGRTHQPAQVQPQQISQPENPSEPQVEAPPPPVPPVPPVQEPILPEPVQPAVSAPTPPPTPSPVPAQPEAVSAPPAPAAPAPTLSEPVPAQPEASPAPPARPESVAAPPALPAEPKAQTPEGVSAPEQKPPAAEEKEADSEAALSMDSIFDFNVGNDTEDGQQKVRHFFSEEAFEHLASFRATLDELRFDLENRELMGNGERTARTLKGSALILGFEKMGRVISKIEEVFRQGREGWLTLDYGMLNVLYDLIEAMGSEVEAISEGLPPKVNLLSFINRLNPILRTSGSPDASAPARSGGSLAQQLTATLLATPASPAPSPATQPVQESPKPEPSQTKSGEAASAPAASAKTEEKPVVSETPAPQIPPPAPAAVATTAPADEAAKPAQPAPVKATVTEQESGDLLTLFRQEASDNITRVSEALCDLEMNPENGEKLSELFRLLNLLKGSAGMMRVRAVELLAQAMENSVTSLMSSAFGPDQIQIEALFEAHESLKKLSQSVTSSNQAQDEPAKEALSKLTKAFPGLSLVKREEAPLRPDRARSGDSQTSAPGAQPFQPPVAQVPQIIRNIPEEDEGAGLMKKPSVTLEQIDSALGIGGQTPQIIRNIPEMEESPHKKGGSASAPPRPVAETAVQAASLAPAREQPQAPSQAPAQVQAQAQQASRAQNSPESVPLKATPSPTAGTERPQASPAGSGAPLPQISAPHTPARVPAQPPAAAPVATQAPAQVQPAAPRAQATTAVAGASTVRVDIEKLDSLLNLLGELVIHKIRLDQRVDTLSTVVESLNINQGKLFYIGRDIKEFSSRGEYRNFVLPGLDQVQEEIVQASHTLHQFTEFDELSGELAKIIQAVSDISQELAELADDLNFSILNVGKITNELQEKIMKVRMLPVQRVFEKFPRVVRDLSRKLDKKVRLYLEGEDTELDKTVLEKIGDPLMHLLRNTLDHGIESPQEREAMGKSAEGTVILRAFYKGNHIFIEVLDDGRGISPAKIRRKILEKELMSEQELSKLSDQQVVKVIFQPGFSTAEAVTDVSGRGVGMDVVKNNIELLKGVIDIDTQVGKGTKFTIKLPLTLAIIQALVVEAAGQKYCIPLSSVQETIKIGLNEIDKVGDRDVIFLRDEVISLVHLASVLEIDARAELEDRKYPVVIVSSAHERLGLMVDHLYGKQEIVIKTLGDFLQKVPNITGATILGDGQVLLIVDVSGIINQANRFGTMGRLMTGQPAGDSGRSQSRSKATILVVDDSLTIRNIEKNLLQSAGYEVLTAENGVEALQMLNYEKIDMVITDVEMPRMNGYQLAREIRVSSRLRNLPIVMITTKSGEADRLRGLKSGADVYIGKPFIQSSLLDTIAKLLVRDDISRGEPEADASDADLQDRETGDEDSAG